MTEIIVRLATPEDAEGIIAHMIRIAAEPDTYVSYTSDEAAVPIEKEALRIQKHLESKDLKLVAEAESKIIAQMTCIVDRFYAITRHTAVLGMSVDRDYRNRSLGSTLMERAVEWAQEHGIVRLELEVYTENGIAIRLYEKFGFEIEGRKRLYAYQRGRYYDSYIMSRLFHLT